MKIKTQRFRVPEGKDVALEAWPTVVMPFYDSKDEYEGLLGQQKKRLGEKQHLLYAADRHSLLVIFQAMDAAGKDGVIRHVLTGINPQGCRVYSFKHPSAQELDHDFLWRAVAQLPERGAIGVFNRSYYEEVLIVRVHPELLAAEGVPDGQKRKSLNEVWEERYRSIRDFERHLHKNGTRVIKIFLHLSKEEQRKRFLARIDDPTKNWKFTQADLSERKYWKRYMHAYEACLTATATKASPWYVVPADDKPNARLIVSQILLDHMSALDLDLPPLSAAHRRQLAAARKQLMNKQA
jgi:PPK2 family polyphosphate:nucleotide phosphotransferase